MTSTAPDLRVVLRYLIHAGLVEIRSLGYLRGSHDQIAHLADVLEFLPGRLEGGREPDFAVVLEQFEAYAARYPESDGRRYVEFLTGERTVPDHY